MIERYRETLDDPARLGAFQRAIAAVVAPGAVVVDVGCGLGTYAIFAARAGARRVFAVDDSPMVAVAREVVHDNGLDGVIDVLAGYSTALTPPEPCDIAIFDDYLTTLVSPHKARVVADLFARWLKPGGRLLPPRARLWLAPVEDPALYLSIDRFHASGDRVFGVDVGATRRRIFATPQPQRLGAGTLICAPELAHEYDFLALGRLEVSVTRTLAARRAGVIHGLCLWFDLDVGGSWFGMGPLAPPSSRQQMLFPLATPIPVGDGARVELALSAVPTADALVWRWSVGAAGRHCDATSLDGDPL